MNGVSPLAVRRPRAVIIVNPSKVDVAVLRAQVRRQELAHGWDASHWSETSIDSPGAAQARRATNHRADLVIAVGGDGTVRAVAEGLSGKGMTLAIVPVGTGNLLARNLGLPINDLGAALRVAFTGRTRRIDVGRLRLTHPTGETTEEMFLVMAGMGLDARMILNTNPALKERFGWLAYIDAIARTLATPTVLNTTFSVDGSPWRSATINTLILGNCGEVQGHLRLLPDARLDDGVLDFISLRSLALRDRTRVAAWLGWENSAVQRFRRRRGIPSESRRAESFRYGQARRIQVKLEHPEYFEVDGDDAGLVTEIEAWADRRVLPVRVLAPRGITLG